MSFTICESVSTNPYYPPVPTNKYFVDGVQSIRTWTNSDGKEVELRPKYYKEIPYTRDEASAGNSVLEDIYEVINYVEANNAPWLIVPEKVIKKKDDGTFRLSTTDGYLEADALRTWGQLDIDLEVEDSNYNDLSLRQRLTVALDGLPFLTLQTGMVVHLSNKAFVPNPDYKDRLSLRIYFELSKPATLQELRTTFKPFEPIVDCSMFGQGSIHLIQPPECVGECQREVEGDSVLYIPGKPLSLLDVRSGAEYQERRITANAFQDSVNNVKSWSADSDEWKSILELARNGYFYKNRHKTFYKIIAEAFWVTQNADTVIDLMASDYGDPRTTVLGRNRDKNNLKEILEQVKKQAHDYFVRPISKHQFDHTLKDPAVADLKNADLSELCTVVKKNLQEQKEIVLAVHSAHGSSKTTAIIPLLEETYRDCFPTQETVRILYISTLRTIISGMCPKFKLTSYLSNSGRPSQEVVIDADRLGICIRSLSLCSGGKPYDIVILDESEHIGMWAAWDNSCHNILIDLLGYAKLGVLLDADAGDMTYSILDRASKVRTKHKLLLDNTGSWIRTQNQVLNFIPRPKMLKDLICESSIDGDEFVFVHCDIADDDSEKVLQAHVDTFNEMYGAERAYKFDSSTPFQERIELATNTNEVLERLYERGIRIIMVSPVWQSGLRYTGKYNFDKTFGLYMNDFISPKMIVQRIQRVILCREHYLYVSAASHYIDEKTLQKQLDEYQGITEQTTAVWDRELDKVQLKNQAIKLTEIFDSNIKLHTHLYWQSFGGQSLFWEDDRTADDEEDWFSTALQTHKKKIEREAAQVFLDEPHRLEMLLRNYTARDGKPYKLPIRTNKQVRTLLKSGRQLELTEELAQEALHLLATNETDWIEWAFKGAPWQSKTIEEISEYNFTDSEVGYTVLGKLLYEIQLHLPFEEESLIHWLLYGTNPMVIERNGLNKTNILKIAEHHKDILNARYGDFYRRNIKASHFVKAFFSKVLLCPTSTESPTQSSLPVSKAKIIADYMERGKLPKRKTPPVNAYIKEVNKSIKDKIINGFELTDAEQIYLEETDLFITIHPPRIFSRRRYDTLLGCLDQTIEREIKSDTAPATRKK